MIIGNKKIRFLKLYNINTYMIDYNSFSILNFYTPHMAQIRNKIGNDEINEYKRLLLLQKSKQASGPNR